MKTEMFVLENLSAWFFKIASKNREEFRQKSGQNPLNE